MPVVEIAPEPHEVFWKFWKLPLLGYSSPWQKAGAIDVRIAGIAVSKVPFVNANEEVTEWPNPMFAILLESGPEYAGQKAETSFLGVCPTNRCRSVDAAIDLSGFD